MVGGGGEGPKSSKNGSEYYPMFFLDSLLISSLLNKMKVQSLLEFFFSNRLFFRNNKHAAKIYILPDL